MVSAIPNVEGGIVFFCLLFSAIALIAQEYSILTVAAQYGSVIVTPPGQIVRGNGFFIFPTGTEVTLETDYSSDPTVYCPAAVVSHQWSGDWTGDTADTTGTILLNSDKSVTAAFDLLFPPCVAPMNMLRVTPYYTTVRAGKSFASEVLLSYTQDMVTGYDITVSYDPAVIEPDPGTGNNGVVGATTVVLDTPGELQITAVDTNPASSLCTFFSEKVQTSSTISL